MRTSALYCESLVYFRRLLEEAEPEEVGTTARNKEEGHVFKTAIRSAALSCFNCIINGPRYCGVNEA